HGAWESDLSHTYKHCAPTERETPSYDFTEDTSQPSSDFIGNLPDPLLCSVLVEQWRGQPLSRSGGGRPVSRSSESAISRTLGETLRPATRRDVRASGRSANAFLVTAAWPGWRSLDAC